MSDRPLLEPLERFENGDPMDSIWERRCLAAEVRGVLERARLAERMWQELAELREQDGELFDKQVKEARGLAREYLHALEQMSPYDVSALQLEKDLQSHPWLLEPEPATATGVAEAVFGEPKWGPALTVVEVDGNKMTLADTWGGGKVRVQIEFTDEQGPIVE